MPPHSLLVTTSAKLIAYLAAAVAFWLWLRGHNNPGGGFIAGVVMAAGILPLFLTKGRNPLPVSAAFLGAVGLLAALISGLFIVSSYDRWLPYLTHRWIFPGGIPLGTPMLFDAGVFFAVFGSILWLFEEYFTANDATLQ
jgi:multisubunit Na+/H+ antiporter MnhB subunit